MAGRRRPVPAGEVAWADVPARQAKMLGSLPVIASFCRRLDISGVIEELVPIRPVASLTVGQAVEAMICNRLTSPAPLVHVQDWDDEWVGGDAASDGDGQVRRCRRGHAWPGCR